jgi:membrane-bound lytic murein transglycosylase D
MKRPVILAAGTPQILLPWDNATVFERNLQAHADQRLATWTAWQAPKTMKPEEAAELLGMPVAQLRSVNDIPPRMMITAGSTLLVHRKGQLDKDVTEHLADNGQLGLAPEMVLKRIRVKARKGDSLASLAARHGVSEANMAAWNQLKVNAPLASGQSLTILVPSQAARRVTRPNPGKTQRHQASQPQRKKPSKTPR